MQVSYVCAVLANLNRDPKRHGPYKPDDFNPLRQKREQVIDVTDKTMAAFCKAFGQEP